MNQIIKDLERKQKCAFRRMQVAERAANKGRGELDVIKASIRNELGMIYHLTRAIATLRKLDSFAECL